MTVPFADEMRPPEKNKMLTEAVGVSNQELLIHQLGLKR
jgi:hypothetical protein